MSRKSRSARTPAKIINAALQESCTACSDQEPARRLPTLICVHDEQLDTEFPMPLDHIRPADHLETRKALTDFTRRGTARYRSSKTAKLVYESAQHATTIRAPLRGAGGRPVGRGQALREPAQLLRGSVPEALGYQAGHAATAGHTEVYAYDRPDLPGGHPAPPRPPALAGMHRNHGRPTAPSGTRTPKTGTPSLTPSTTATFPV